MHSGNVSDHNNSLYAAGFVRGHRKRAFSRICVPFTEPSIISAGVVLPLSTHPPNLPRLHPSPQRFQAILRASRSVVQDLPKATAAPRCRCQPRTKYPRRALHVRSTCSQHPAQVRARWGMHTPKRRQHSTPHCAPAAATVALNTTTCCGPRDRTPREHARQGTPHPV